VKVEKKDADLVVRAVSSGDWHATIPGTTLAAVNLALGTEGTVIQRLVHPASSDGSRVREEQREGKDEVVQVRAGHAAGVATASVRFEEGKPVGVVMWRTAREIMRGEIVVPEKLLYEDSDVDVKVKTT